MYMFIPIKNKDEEFLKNYYLKLSKFILLLVIIYSIWIGIIIIGVYFVGSGNRWAIFSMDQWIISSVGLFSIFVVLEILFFIHYFMVKTKRIKSEKPKTLFFKGKKLHIFTLPLGSKGGIYSKTYIDIDNANILNLRYQMIPQNEILEQNQE